MKKNLAVLLAAVVLTMTAATAAESTGPVSSWLNKITSKVSQEEQSVTNKTQSEQQKIAAKKKAHEEKVAAQKAKAQAKKDKAEETKKNLKELFTIGD